jgi:hypothetical protein
MLSKGMVVEVCRRTFVANWVGKVFPHARSRCHRRRRLPHLLPGCAATPVGWSAACWGTADPTISAAYSAQCPCLRLGHASMALWQPRAL